MLSSSKYQEWRWTLLSNTEGQILIVPPKLLIIGQVSARFHVVSGEHCLFMSPTSAGVLGEEDEVPGTSKKKKKKAHTLYIFRLKFFIFTGEFPHVRMNGSRANADTITRCLFDPRVSGQIESSIPLSPNEIWCGWVACSYFWCHLLSWSCSTAAEQRQRCHSYVG